MDAIHKECYKDMDAKLNEREEFFNKEIVQFKKEQAGLEKKLEKLEVPPPVDMKSMPGYDKIFAKEKNAKKVAAKDKNKKAVKKTKKELQAEEEERKRKEAEEEERKRKEEEEEKKK